VVCEGFCIYLKTQSGSANTYQTTIIRHISLRCCKDILPFITDHSKSCHSPGEDIYLHCFGIWTKALLRTYQFIRLINGACARDFQLALMAMTMVIFRPTRSPLRLQIRRCRFRIFQFRSHSINENNVRYFCDQQSMQSTKPAFNTFRNLDANNLNQGENHLIG
jgi:hypothetical protein